jgi:hypothetical protein
MGSHEKSDDGVREFARTQSPQGNCVPYFGRVGLTSGNLEKARAVFRRDNSNVLVFGIAATKRNPAGGSLK